MKVIAADSETLPIGPDAVYPRPVCLAYNVIGEQEVHLVTDYEPKKLRDTYDMLYAPGHILVWHNGPFDQQAAITSWPDLVTSIWRKLRANEVTDTMTRQKLAHLATHGQLESVKLPDGTSQQLGYSLVDLGRMHLGKDRSDEKNNANAWQKNYHLLSGRPLSHWPVEAIQYPKDDAADCGAIYEKQEYYRQFGAFTTEFFRARAAFALSWCTRHGLLIDEEWLMTIMRRLEADNADHMFPHLLKSGILRPSEPARPWANGAKNKDGTPKMKAPVKATIDTKKLAAEVRRVSEERGLEVELTPGGDPCTKVEIITEIADGSPALKDYEKRDVDKKLISTEVPRMCWPRGSGIPARSVHAGFKELVSTGRTASFGGSKNKPALYPSLNGQNVDPRIRPCVVPRTDMLLMSADFSSMELVTCAQRMLDLFGYSKLADKLNAGQNAHTYLGSNLAKWLHPEMRTQFLPLSDDDRYTAFLGIKKTNPVLFKDWRDFAKPVGLGLPGGLGAEKFITFARTQYGVDLRAMAPNYVHLFAWGSTVHYYAERMKLVQPQGHWRNPERSQKAKDMGVDLDVPSTWPAHLQAIGLAALLKEIWFDTYPEMREYFKLVPTWKDEMNVVPGRRPLFYTSPFGMIRRNADFPAAANGYALQTPGAELALTAMIDWAQACSDPSLKSVLYGSNPQLFIHDELYGEVWEEIAHESCMEIKRIMEDASRVVCPGVRGEANPVLMYRWYKEAEPVWENGRLVPWTPPPPKVPLALAA